MKKITLLVLAFIVLGSCEKNVVEVSKPAIDYFPLKIGEKFIYEVDSIVYKGRLAAVDTIKYEQRLEILGYDSVKNEFLVSASYSTNKINWQFQRNYTIAKSTNQLIINEFNEPVLPLVYPPLLYKTWDTNQYNTKRVAKAVFDNIDTTCVVSGVEYQNCVSVYEEESRNPVNNIYAKRIYAPFRGLVYSFSQNTNTQGIFPNLEIRGTIVKRRLLE